LVTCATRAFGKIAHSVGAEQRTILPDGSAQVETLRTGLQRKTTSK
jgi:hypothetical protein